MGGTGNIGGDPQFADPDGKDNVLGTLDDDLRLSAGSACIDAAANVSAGPDETDVDDDGDVLEAMPFDVDGNLRFIDVLGTPDTGLGSSPVVDMGAYERIADCNSNEVPDEQDIADGTSQDCNGDSLPDECQVSPDCNDNGVCDEEDCNDNGTPDECEADCNDNGVQDECDIAEGDSDDCNQDGIPVWMSMQQCRRRWT